MRFVVTDMQQGAPVGEDPTETGHGSPVETFRGPEMKTVYSELFLESFFFFFFLVFLSFCHFLGHICGIWRFPG